MFPSNEMQEDSNLPPFPICERDSLIRLLNAAGGSWVLKGWLVGRRIWSLYTIAQILVCRDLLFPTRTQGWRKNEQWCHWRPMKPFLVSGNGLCCFLIFPLLQLCFCLGYYCVCGEIIGVSTRDDLSTSHSPPPPNVRSHFLHIGMTYIWYGSVGWFTVTKMTNPYHTIPPQPNVSVSSSKDWPHSHISVHLITVLFASKQTEAITTTWPWYHAQGR